MSLELNFKSRIKMRITVLFTLVFLVGCQQSFQSNLHKLIDVEYLDADPDISTLRDLSDIWNKIKSKIINAWEAFKNIAHNTRKHVQDYLRKIREKIKNIAKAFEKKLENLEKDFRKIIENVIATGESVKNCLKNDKEVIGKLLKEILINVTICISSNMNHISKLEISHDLLQVDDSLFVRSVENKMTANLKMCKGDNEVCLGNVKEEILKDLDIATGNVSKKALEIRKVVDDGLHTIAVCVTEGLMKASTSIVNETAQIIQCVKSKQ